MAHTDLGRLYPVVLQPHNPEWILSFEREKTNLVERLLPLHPLRIEHIGSTAIRGITAKPTVDILLGISEDPQQAELYSAAMIESGYIKMEEQTRHLMFVKGYSPHGLMEESFHVHIGSLKLDWLWDRIYFRDYLNEFPETAAEYEKLKQMLAGKFRYDREAYTDGKSDFITRITAQAKSHYTR